MEEMGEMGAGITCEDEINMNVKNVFTTKWEIIKEACPWFFEMRELIAERPNQVPVGLGNSATGFDMTVITAGSEFEPSSGIEDWGSDTVGNKNFRDLSEGATEELDNKNTFDSSTMYSLKRKASMSSETRDQGLATPKTGPQPGISKPATRAPKNTVKKPKKDEFVELVQAEEMTRQKELDLAKAKAEKDTIQAKIKLAKVELEKEKLADARERRHEKAERRQQYMGGRTQQHGSPYYQSASPPLSYAESYPGDSSSSFNFPSTQLPETQ
ncbi:hypothetical protein EV424DRAFT_1352573 [Suillus variegatus]|nr:hypothetical protein EV424DRAFT_1352573 [Suillus variegatus]